MNALNASITSALKTDPVLLSLGVTNVYKDEAPQGTPTSPMPTPYIIYGKQGGPWETHMGGTTNREPRYYIKAVDRSTSSVRAGNIDEQIAYVVHTQKFAGGARSYRGFRSGDMPDVSEIADGVTWKHVGGLYKFVPA